jgi:DNA polymerase III epsilon subunit-like protein
MGTKPVPEVVFLILETTGGSYPIRPVQIAAIHSRGRKTFSQYVNPGKEINPHATKVNGFTYDNYRSVFISFFSHYMGYTIVRS